MSQLRKQLDDKGEEDQPSDLELELETILGAGGCDARIGKYATKWNKERKYNIVLAAKYKELGRKYDAQRAFKLDWIKGLLKEARETRHTLRIDLERSARFVC